MQSRQMTHVPSRPQASLLRQASPLALTLCLLLAGASGCSVEDEGIPSGASSPLRIESAANETAYDILRGSRRLARIPVANTNLDRLEADSRNDDVLAALQHGEEGGSSLLLASPGQEIQALARVDEGRSILTPRWSPDGSLIAYVVELPPRWMTEERTPHLQHQGELWWGAPGGRLQRLSGLRDAARVLGWADESTLLVTRHLPGDLVREAVYRVELSRMTLEPLIVPQGGEDLLGFALSRGRLLYARADSPIVTLPAPWQRVELIVAGLDGQTLSSRPLDPGVLPAEMSLDPGESAGADDNGEMMVRFIVDGSGEERLLDLLSGRWRSGVSPVPQVPAITPGTTMSSLKMSYVHQVYDTPNEFAGHWACGPASAVMGLTQYGRLPAWPITINVPSPHTNNYGAYVAYKYTLFGSTFNRMQTDSLGEPAYGAYGWGTDGGVAWAWRLQDYAKKHDTKSDFYASPSTFAQVKSAIDAGKAVVLSTQLTSGGHIIAVKGYTSDGKLITNDPYGNKNQGYMNYKGEGAIYTWSQIAAKWHITIYGAVTTIGPIAPTGPSYKASLVKVSYPGTMDSGSTATVSVTYKNEGSATWNGATLLATTEPRDRASAFFTKNNWINKSRVAATGSVAPGATTTISFQLTAPTACEETTYYEHFNLLQDGTTWFSDSNQGGPSDKALVMKIKVTSIDADGDGVSSCYDCDDNDPEVYPGAPEICNGKDDNCNGQVDEGLPYCFPGDVSFGCESYLGLAESCVVGGGAADSRQVSLPTPLLFLLAAAALARRRRRDRRGQPRRG